jgi:hypothetical protein
MNNRVLTSKEDNLNDFSHFNPFIKTMYKILSLAIRPVEAALRSNFGERYFSVLGTLLSGLLSGWIALGASTVLTGEVLMSNYYSSYSSYSSSSSQESFSMVRTFGVPIFALITISFGLLVWWRLIEIHLRNRKGIKWHSYSTGISHPFIRNLSNNGLYRAIFGRDISSYYTSKLLTEPFFLIAVSVVALIISKGIALYFFINAILLFVKELIEYSFQRNIILNILDGQIESGSIEAIVDGEKDPNKTNGFTVIVPDNTATNNSGVDIKELLKNKYSNN